MITIRLIDARRGLSCKCRELFGNEKIADEIYRYLCDGLEECENVEPERRNGKWIKKEKIYPELPEDSDYRFECSLCGWSDQHNDKMIVPYCWHCGSEMER